MTAPFCQPYTDAELGFTADESLRAGISSWDFVASANALLVQIARQNQRILDALAANQPAPTTPTNPPAS